MKGEIPDWVRLQKALSVEAEKGYPDLQGNQYRFRRKLLIPLPSRQRLILHGKLPSNNP